MKKFVVIVAGGKGLRMGNDLPKQFIPIHGKPILMHTLIRFYEWDASASLILVLPEDYQAYWQMLCKELDFRIPHVVANAGETRFHSVKNGLSLVGSPGLIAVHDGVRPFVSCRVIDICFAEAEKKGAVIPVVPIMDSIRRQTENGGTAPVDRSQYMAVQTPQVFKSELLLEAYALPYVPAFTDDASVVEAAGYTIHPIQGDRENIKITTPVDVLIAEAYMQNREDVT